MSRKERTKSGQFTAGNPGRPVGSKNKFTTLKVDWLAVHERMGGADGLYAYAKVHPGWFYTNETRLFPQEVAHSGAIKTNDRLIIEVVHTRPEKAEGGNGSGGNGGGKK